MNTLLNVERKIRKTVFTSIWRMFDIKSLSDLALFAAICAGIMGVMYLLAQGIINWL